MLFVCFCLFVNGNVAEMMGSALVFLVFAFLSFGSDDGGLYQRAVLDNICLLTAHRLGIQGAYVDAQNPIQRGGAAFDTVTVRPMAIPPLEPSGTSQTPGQARPGGATAGPVGELDVNWVARLQSLLDGQ